LLAAIQVTLDFGSKGKKKKKKITCGGGGGLEGGAIFSLIFLFLFLLFTCAVWQI
jgi:hypothetical protein